MELAHTVNLTLSVSGQFTETPASQAANYVVSVRSEGLTFSASRISYSTFTHCFSCDGVADRAVLNDVLIQDVASLIAKSAYVSVRVESLTASHISRTKDTDVVHFDVVNPAIYHFPASVIDSLNNSTSDTQSSNIVFLPHPASYFIPIVDLRRAYTIMADRGATTGTRFFSQLKLDLSDHRLITATSGPGIEIPNDVGDGDLIAGCTAVRTTSFATMSPAEQTRLLRGLLTVPTAQRDDRTNQALLRSGIHPRFGQPHAWHPAVHIRYADGAQELILCDGISTRKIFGGAAPDVPRSVSLSTLESDARLRSLQLRQAITSSGSGQR